MSLNFPSYTGNGSTTDYSFSFTYLDRSHVKVSVNGTPTTAFTFHNATTIRFDTAPADGAQILIYRETPSDGLLGDFSFGGAIREQDLEDTLNQVLFVAQETVNTVENSEASSLSASVAAANATAGTANSTANTALSTAQAAESTANSISGAVTTANNTAASAVSTANAAQSTANAAAATAAAAAQNVSLGLRNLIINGSMLVSQRGSSFNLAANTGAYTLDRWLCSSIGGVASIQQVIVDRAARLRFTGGAGSTNSIILQRIESWDIAHLAGQQVTLSFDVSNTLRTDLIVNLTYPNVADNYATYTAGPTANVTVNSTLTRYSVSFTLGAQAINGLQVGFTFANQTSGSFDLARVQLEAGPLATPFETLPFTVETTLCKRYFHYVPVNLWGIATGPLQIIETGIPFPTRMRVVPFIGALQADPEAGATSLNNNAQSIGRVTSQWASPYVQAAAAGQFYILGYRFPLDAEL
jgi:hypothetical protein